MTSIDKLRQAVEEAPSGSKAATMRALLPSIERQISQGIHYRDIVEALNKNGFEISFNTFVVTLRRLRKEKKQEKEEAKIEETKRRTRSRRRKKTKARPTKSRRCAFQRPRRRRGR